MGKLIEPILSEYNERRVSQHSSVDLSNICNAPFNNMYFTTVGTVAPCWLLVGQVETWSKDRSIADIWFGEKFQQIRNDLKQNLFNGECSVCEKNICKKVWPLAMAYDQFSLKKYPTLMELELSNQCNLECIMCEGRLSSGIRKNRDKLPPLPMIYDETFVEQLKEFIPHLEELRFNGGEPLAQNIVHDICRIAYDLNPTLKINIATNGTVYNKNVQWLLEHCNVHFNISIDSLDKDNYESIRINGNFEHLMQNFEIFRDYCHAKNRILSIMVNPMKNNWWEMIDFVHFVEKHNVHLWYNTIHHPKHLSLWALPKNELHIARNRLTSDLDDIVNRGYSPANIQKFTNFVKQVSNWFERI
jgi:radical SAM protein with 4Fe4S-binding SPASM domain